MNTPIYFYKAKNLSNLKADSIVAVKNDNESAFSLYVTDRSGIPYPLKGLQNNVIITNTDGNLQITSSSTITNINLASSILATINSALQNGDSISELVNDVGYLTSFTETDPIFQASEASLFVSGDKANLDNQSGINSGDQNSIIGISGTKSEFNTELTDGDFLFVGDIPEFNPLDYDLDDFTNVSADPFARTSELTSGITNLTYTPSATNGIVVSDTGTDATIPSADFTNAGLLTPEEKQLIYNNSSTGVTKFEGFSINADTTKYNTGLIEGWFIDNTTNPNMPTKVFKSFAPTIANTLTNIATQNVTYIATDINGVHQQSGTPFEPNVQRDWIPLGVIVHSNRLSINAVNNQPVVAISPNNQLSDLMEGIGVFNVNGNVLSPNGNNLSINKSAGHIFKQGSNFISDVKDPHTTPLSALVAPNNIRYRTQLGAESADTSVVFPNFWDNGGILTAMTGTRWSIQRIYIFQSNLIRIQYGQATYENLAEAIQAVQTEAFTVEQNILENGLFRGLLIVRRNATDLTDSARALFIEASKFGSVAGLGSLSTTNLQQAYNNSITPEITTDSVLGAVTIKRGSALDTDNVIEIQDGTGTTTASITGEGGITALNYNGYTPENTTNKQNDLTPDGTGINYPTVDAVNTINLQKIFDVGSDASVVSGDNFSNLEISSTYTALSQGNSFASSRSGFYIDNGVLSIHREDEIGLNKTSIKIDAPTVISTLNFPAKTVEGTYTLATTDDVESIGLNNVLAYNSMSDIPIIIKESTNALVHDSKSIYFSSDDVGVPQVNLFFRDGFTTGGLSFKFPFSKPLGTYTLATTDDVDAKITQTITNGVTDKSPSEDVIYDTFQNYSKIILKNTTTSTPVTLTLSQTILYSDIIRANSFKNGDFFNVILSRVGKIGTAGTLTQTVRINTTNTLAGATIIASNTGTTANLNHIVGRRFSLESGFLNGFAGGSAPSDMVNSSAIITPYAFDPTVDNYIFVVGQLTNTGDSMFHSSFILTN